MKQIEPLEQWDPQVRQKLKNLRREQQTIWKVIKGFKNYEVSDMGQIRNVTTGRILRPGYTNGYAIVVLYKNGKEKGFLVHRLVAEAFLKKQDKSLKQIIHINGITTDNRLENLRWVRWYGKGIE